MPCHLYFIEADGMIHGSTEWGLDRIDQFHLPLNNVYSPKGKVYDVFVEKHSLNEKY